MRQNLTTKVGAYGSAERAIAAFERGVSQLFTQPYRPQTNRKAELIIRNEALFTVVAELETGLRDKAWSVTGGDRPMGAPMANPAGTLPYHGRASRRAAAGGTLGSIARGDVGRVPGSARAGNRRGERCHLCRHGHIKRPRRGYWRTLR